MLVDVCWAEGGAAAGAGSPESGCFWQNCNKSLKVRSGSFPSIMALVIGIKGLGLGLGRE
jgi:hypothetical protein